MTPISIEKLELEKLTTLNYWFHNLNCDIFHLRISEANLNIRDHHINSLDMPSSKLGKTNSIQLNVNSLPNRDVLALV